MRRCLALFALAFVLSPGPVFALCTTQPFSSVVALPSVTGFDTMGAGGRVSATLQVTAGTVTGTFDCGVANGPPQPIQTFTGFGTASGTYGNGIELVWGDGPCSQLRFNITTCTGCTGTVYMCAAP